MEKALTFKQQIEDDTINSFISQQSIVEYLTCQMLEVVLDNEAQGDLMEEYAS